MNTQSHTKSTSRSLPIALLRARETIMAPIRDMLQDIQISEQKWRVLRVLDELGEVEQSAIAKEACLLLPSLTRILRSMEADGQVTRRQDSQDKRRTMVMITDAGRQILKDNLQASLAISNSIEAQMGREKLDELLDLLEELQAVKV
ncbi:homoprotocatechuate degradation operon regulator HpaR (plasmid) [Ruegeria sp. SCSIO 43209]|jgi:homoprotocatechuate degradation regulator HpaR|uniref:homoprotocatechuate degradation operon regulator HpaR n=1 Tax=Ruegeria sp. SCSIO 43209 TaxID=2793010 RepID=UPI001479AAE0|nr:homoprotocatechuate degradation operon regulator HpaR [Ruegeria sp. SCSIO 43209]UAB91526.1 homoprotocatechuate degradation operon regulator HpaR [Ruegeria sp. SCSIO 43209]